MKRIGAAFVTILVLSCILMSIPIYAENPAVVWKFDDENEITQFFEGTNNVTISVENGVMKLALTGVDPLIWADLRKFDGKLQFSLDTYKYMKIKYKADTNDTISELFFGTVQNLEKGEDIFTGTRMLNLTLEKNKWDEKVFNMGQLSPQWTGTLAALRFDPIANYAANDTFYISYIAFFATEAEANAFDESKITSHALEILSPQTTTAAPAPETSGSPQTGEYLFAVLMMTIAMTAIVPICYKKARTLKNVRP